MRRRKEKEECLTHRVTVGFDADMYGSLVALAAKSPNLGISGYVRYLVYREINRSKPKAKKT